MLGLIKKDFFIMKSNLKTIVIIFIAYLIMAIQGSFNITFVIPMIGMMLFITTFSYDDFNNWNAYVSAIPNGRKNAVKAKYIFSIFLMIILTLISFVVSTLINYINTNNTSIETTISSVMGILLSVDIIISLLYPIMFKYGSTNGRIILFIFVFIIAGIIALISNVLNMTSIIRSINILEKYAYITIPAISIILLIVSYLISSKVYQNKEF